MIEYLKNKLKLNKKGESGAAGNEIEAQPLLEAEAEKLKQAYYNFKPARPDFQAELMRKILDRRQNPMKKAAQIFIESLTLKRLTPVLAVIVLVAVVAGTIRFFPLLFPGQGEEAFNKFSKLIINSAYAMDNFELKPEKIDSTGVAGDIAYRLTSKDEVDEKLIRENIKVEPEIDFTLEKISAKEWKLRTKQALPANTILKVTLNTSYYDDAGLLQKRDYRWAYQVKDSFKVLTTIPRDTGTGVPNNSGIEITFSHENFVDYEKYFSISPQTEGRFEKHGRTLVFVPTAGLKTGTIYTVTVKAGLPLSGSDQKLAEPKVIQFETDGVQRFGSGYGYGNDSYFNIYEKMLEFSSTETPVVQLYTNQDNKQVGVKVYRLASEQAYLEALRNRDRLPWWSYSRDYYNYDTSKLTQFRSLSAPIKKGRYVQFIEFPESLPLGFYIVDFEMKGEKQQAWFQITDLSAYVNTTKTKTIVWVNDLTAKQQAAGAQLRLVGQNLNYSANDKGVAIFDTPAQATERINSDYLEITHQGKSLIMPVNSRDRYGNNPVRSEESYWRYLYSDRPQYQPTDTIKFWGLLKDRQGKKISEKISLALIKEGYFDYNYSPVSISEHELALNDLGTYSGEIPLKNIRPDYYVLQLRVGDLIVASKYIQISAYTKPAYQLSLTPDRRYALAGDNINFDVQASFFEGTPAPNLPLVFKMPEGDYKFTTDENGQAKLTYTVKYFDCHDQYSCWPDSTWLRIEPQNSELAEISAETSVVFYGAKRYAKTEVTYPNKGQADLKISTFYLDLAGLNEQSWRENMGDQPAPGTQIKGEVVKITYIKKQAGTYYDFISKKSYPIYDYDIREETVNFFDVKSGPDGIYNYKINIVPETSYRVMLRTYAEGRYDLTSAYLYYYDGSGIDYYGSAYSNYYSFNLPADKTYNLGERVSADMRQNEKSLPDGGTNKYLFMQLQNGLQEYSLSDNSTYNFNFEERDIPNVNLSGVYFNGRSYFSTIDSWWGNPNNVKYDTKNRELTIDIKTDKASYQPGENVDISLLVKDQKGNPVKSEVNVNMIDEAYYAVRGDTADPLGSIYASVSQGSYFSKYSHKTLNDASGAEGGGCFLAGTKILMADGSSKPIEKIEVNDQIKTITDTARLKYDQGRVAELFKHKVGGYLIINGKLRLTPEHRVYSNYSFVAAGELRQGDWLLDQDGNKIFITSIESKREIVEVYNFRVEPQHTYIADGFYVHNDKGGERELLLDAPLFATVLTGENGRGTVTLKLPDNVTSWRVTTQAISKNLDVGTAVGQVKVSLPVFIDATVGSEYLVEDKPVARLRAYGAKLNGNDDATFNLKAESLGVKQSGNVAAKAFKAAFIELPKLILGRHVITYNLITAKGADALKLPLNVISSRLEKREAVNQPLTVDTKIEAKTDGPITVILGDINRAQFYYPLVSLGWSWADRIDQAIARKKSVELLNKLFKEDRPVPAVNASLFQTSSGGVALLPYSDDDLALSAKLANIAADEFDQASLEQYFLSVFNDKKSNREEISLSLYGLASLNAPVLPLLNIWSGRDDLSVKEKLYLALAFNKIGAAEKARAIYYQIAGQYGQQKLPSIRISIDNNDETTRELTALTAALAAAVQAPEQDGYWFYLNNNYDAFDAVIDLEKIAYILNAAPDAANAAKKVIYEINGKKTEVDFTDRYVYSFEADQPGAATVKFTEVNGQIGITTITNQPFDPAKEKTDSNLSIKREFYVNGKKTNTFSEKDTIEVRLYPVISRGALEGNYQITDILPSGLLPVTKYYRAYYGSTYGGCHAWYPYNSEGQKIKFMISKGWNNNKCGDYFSYLARVKTKGSYKVEPDIIQSMINPQYVNYDKNSSTIKIN